MSLLDRRNTSAGIIEQRFITATLNKTGKDILADSKREQKGFTSAKWNHVTANASDNTLTYEHLPRHRFVDMKTRNASNRTSATKRRLKSGKIKKKFYPIHNKVIWSNKRFLVKELSFGFTDAVKKQFENLENKANQ